MAHRERLFFVAIRRAPLECARFQVYPPEETVKPHADGQKQDVGSRKWLEL
jgi:hypothetical protein